MPGTEDNSKATRGRRAPESRNTSQTGPDDPQKSQIEKVEGSAQPTDAVISFTTRESRGPYFGRSGPAIQQLASALRHDLATLWRRTTVWLLHALRILKDQSRNTSRRGLRRDVFLSRLSVPPAKIRAMLPVKLSFTKLFKRVRFA